MFLQLNQEKIQQTTDLPNNCYQDSPSQSVTIQYNQKFFDFLQTEPSTLSMSQQNDQNQAYIADSCDLTQNLDPFFDFKNFKFSCELDEQVWQTDQKIVRQQLARANYQVLQTQYEFNQQNNIEKEDDHDDIFFAENYNMPQIKYNPNQQIQLNQQQQIQIKQSNNQQIIKQQFNEQEEEYSHELKNKSSKSTQNHYLNTSHAANTLLNLLTKYIIPLYYTKITCQNNTQMCMKPIQFLKNGTCECQRCEELKFIYKLKYNKNKNLNLFKQLVNLTPRIKIIVEDFILNKISVQLLEKKSSYKSQHTFISLYNTLHSFLKGSRKPEGFSRLI